MPGATPLSTGYDAHAVAKHQLSMAQAANAAVNLDLSFDDEMVEDVNENFSQRVPKGTVFDGYGKSSGKANVRRNAKMSRRSFRPQKDTDIVPWVVPTETSHRSPPLHTLTNFQNP